MKVSIYNDDLSRVSEKYGLKPVSSFLVKNKNEAKKDAKLIGFPVALKIESPDILHKTDIGRVELNIYSEKEVEKAYTKIIYSVLGNINKTCSKPIICGAIGGEYTYYIGKLIKNEGIPIYYSVNE